MSVCTAFVAVVRLNATHPIPRPLFGRGFFFLFSGERENESNEEMRILFLFSLIFSPLFPPLPSSFSFPHPFPLKRKEERKEGRKSLCLKLREDGEEGKEENGNFPIFFVSSYLKGRRGKEKEEFFSLFLFPIFMKHSFLS